MVLLRLTVSVQEIGRSHSPHPAFVKAEVYQDETERTVAPEEAFWWEHIPSILHLDSAGFFFHTGPHLRRHVCVWVFWGEWVRGYRSPPLVFRPSPTPPRSLEELVKICV